MGRQPVYPASFEQMQRVSRTFEEGMAMGEYDGESTFGLIVRFIKLVKSFATLEKAYVKETVQGIVKSSLPIVILGVACLVFMALSGIFLLVTLVLVLNIWFAPWASALIVTAFLFLVGLVMGLVALLKAKKDFGEARTRFGRIVEDMRWLKKS